MRLASQPNDPGDKLNRQAIVRALLESATVEVIGSTERVRVTLRWAGGFESHHEVRRAVGCFEKLEAADQIRDLIVELKRQGASHEVVAGSLNKQGFHASDGGPFTKAVVSQLCRRFRTQGLALESGGVDSQFWTLTSLARAIGVKTETLNTWRCRGWINATRLKSRWMLWADQEELNRLRQLAEYKRRPLQKTPTELTTPKQQPSQPRP